MDIKHYNIHTTSCYRPDDSWMGNSINRYEIQPIVDISKLPEHKNLPYLEAKKLVQYFLENKVELPDFLKMIESEGR